LIVTILSYTVSKLGHFFETQCITKLLVLTEVPIIVCVFPDPVWPYANTQAL